MSIKSTRYRIAIAGVLVFFCVTGCVKNESHYYADPETPNLSIFSNKGFNVLSCFINGQPWQTIPRITGGISGLADYELSIEKRVTSGVFDTLTITWMGNFNKSRDIWQRFGLVLPVAKNFKMEDFSAFQGKRLVIDSTNGYFILNNVQTYNYERGKGVIYFNQASVHENNGRLSGILQADFASSKISSGRFDDVVTLGVILF